MFFLQTPTTYHPACENLDRLATGNLCNTLALSEYRRVRIFFIETVYLGSLKAVNLNDTLCVILSTECKMFQEIL